MNAWALSIPSSQTSCGPATLLSTVFSSKCSHAFHGLLEPLLRMENSLYPTPSFSFPFLSLFKQDTDVTSIPVSRGQVTPKHGWLFSPLPFFLYSCRLWQCYLDFLTGPMHRGDSPTVDGFSHSRNFTLVRENSGFGVGLTSYFGTSVKTTYTQRIWPGYRG